MSMPNRKPYPSDVRDDEWALVAPYLTLLPEDAGQRRYPLRGGAPWRLLLRGAGVRPARAAAGAGGAASPAHGGDYRPPGGAVHARERRPGRLRRGQAAQGGCVVARWAVCC